MNALALALVAAVVWATWPLARTPRARWGLLALVVFLPAAWLVLVPLGIRKRYRDSAALHTVTSSRHDLQRRRDLDYWQGVAETGGPAERQAAEDLLAYWAANPDHAR